MRREDYSAEALAACNGGGVISKEDYLRWAMSGNLLTRALAYAVSRAGWGRIQPEPTLQEENRAVEDYLLECLVIDPPPGEIICTGCEAGLDLAEWLNYLWLEPIEPGAEQMVQDIVRRLLEVFKSCDAESRDRMRCAALERILMQPRLRHFFDAWADDPDPDIRKCHAKAMTCALALVEIEKQVRLSPPTTGSGSES